ncbi:MAG: prepilin peptidase [Kofleriaceae bacterium]|nr:prepilin peptidase [Kofleriaceae bacterium]
MPPDHELARLMAGPGGYVFAFVLGALWGSFANVCIYRMPPSEAHPRGRSVVHPPSHCPACQTPIRWYDNVPIFAYAWLRGRCRACQAEFSPRYLLVEVVTAGLFAVAWWSAVGIPLQLGATPGAAMLTFVVQAAFVVVMVVILFIDLDHRLILDRVTLPSVLGFYAAGLVLGRSWSVGMIGAAVGYGLVWTIAEVYYRVTGREGMGLGDGKLLAVIGALLGWRGVVFALFAGSVLGSVIGVAALAGRGRARPGADAGADGAPAGHGPIDEGGGDEGGSEPTSLRHVELPFGPFLAIAALFYLFAEPWLLVRLRLLAP